MSAIMNAFANTQAKAFYDPFCLSDRLIRVSIITHLPANTPFDIRQVIPKHPKNCIGPDRLRHRCVANLIRQTFPAAKP